MLHASYMKNYMLALKIAFQKCSSLNYMYLDTCTHIGRGGVGIYFDVKRFRMNTYVMYLVYTVKPLDSGHTGGRTLIRCREVVPISEVD